MLFIEHLTGNCLKRNLFRQQLCQWAKALWFDFFERQGKREAACGRACDLIKPVCTNCSQYDWKWQADFLTQKWGSEAGLWLCLVQTKQHKTFRQNSIVHFDCVTSRIQLTLHLAFISMTNRQYTRNTKAMKFFSTTNRSSVQMFKCSGVTWT